MAKRLMKDCLIKRESITEELRLIYGSFTDYVTATGEIYKDYGDGMFYHKKAFLNKHNGYLYCPITYANGQKQRRVHIIVAETYLPNPNNYPVVMHKDNNKCNNNVSNLKWGTVKENSQQSCDDGLTVNAKSWEDSQSVPVCCFNLAFNLLETYGSAREASRVIGITTTAILNQCKHNLKGRPRCGYYFRYYSEYEKKRFRSLTTIESIA